MTKRKPGENLTMQWKIPNLRYVQNMLKMHLWELLWVWLFPIIVWNKSSLCTITNKPVINTKEKKACFQVGDSRKENHHYHIWHCNKQQKQCLYQWGIFSMDISTHMQRKIRSLLWGMWQRQRLRWQRKCSPELWVLAIDKNGNLFASYTKRDK